MTRCWLFHKWGKWIRARYEMTYRGQSFGVADFEERTCERCGKTQIERVTG